MGNKCCKNQSSTYSSANATIRSFSSYNSSILRSGGSHAITFGTSTRAGDSLTTLTMKSSNNSDVGSKDYRGGSSSTVGQEDLIPIFLRRLNDLNIRVGTRTRFLIELDDATGVQVRWYHNNVEADNERYQYIHEGGFYCLDIVPVTLFDEGLWVCTAQNYAGKSSTAAHLSLTVPKAFKKPIFVEQLKAVLTQRGIVSLECKVIGVPTPKLRWYKDDKEIKAGDIFALTANSEEDCLGIYTCEATNVMGTALSTSKIQVTHTPLDGNHDADSLIPYGPPPKFTKFLKNASGKVGSVLFLECQVDVPPWPRSIGWYNDNGIVNEGPLYHLLADGLGMYGVEIKSLRADHSTTWKCVATSSTGTKAVTSCVVSVSYPKNYRVPRFLESLRAIMTDEGLVSFECKVIGYPTPQLLWFKDGKQLQPGDVYELTGSKSLGSYCCVARNCMGETSSLAELTIEDIQNQLNENEKLQLTSNTQPPRFLLGLKSIEANINESFVFMIKVTTESTPSISWYKEDEQLTESNRYQFSTEDNGTYTLNIVPLEIDDQAEWKCVAINKYGQTATSSFLKLNIPKNFKRPRFLEELRIAFSNEGSVNLECKVIGVPQPQLKWFKDGQELNPGDMHKIISGQSGTCCLGTYTCQAHNCMGTVSSSATLLTMEDKSTVKSCASEEYLSVGNPLVRNESLSTIPEERTSQMEKSYTIEEPADISFSFDGKEVTVSLYETPDLTHDEALQIIEMYADELSEHISEDNVVDLPSLRIVKESSISGPVMMEALVIDVPIDFCRQQTVSDTEFDGVSLTEDITLAINDKSESICENSLEYFSDHLSSGNSKREVFYSASETTPKHSSVILKQQSEDDGHQSFQTPKLFMSDSDDQILTQLKLDEKLLSQNSRHVTGPLARSESNNTEEEVSETLAEIENETPLSHNYCASEIVTQSDEDGLYSTVLNKIRDKGMASVILSSEEDNVLKIISRPNVDEFLKYMKIILEGTMVKMRTHENFNFTSTTTELERSIQALHSLAWKFIEETERNDVSELEKNTADNVSSLMTAINASLLALEQIDDPFGVSDNILNEIQSSACFDLETLNNNNLPATEILDRLSDQIKNFTIVVNRQVARVTEQRIIAVLQNTIGTTLVYIKTLQQNCSKIKCVDINSLAPLFSMVQPLETILNDIAVIEEASMDDNKPNFKLKQILIPPISSIAFALDNLNTALKNDSSDDDQDLKDIYDRINESTNQFMTLASHGMESNKIAECFISFTKPINDLCCHLRRLGRSTENIVSSDYGSDDKLLLDFETLFDELMIDIDTLINNVNFVQDSENNMNPLGSLLEPLQDMKIGLFQVNQVLLSNQTGSTMSYEVMSCFEHLSQQLVQLNNCIVNQSIVEETDKEIPFESSIKMMQNILFDDAIDDLGVNGILFGSVMKPLLQLQNLIVSKMASVESDLSFSEHTDVTGGAYDTQSLSLSLSNNAQTVLDKTANENSKQVIIESSIIDSLDENCDKQNNIHKDTSEIEKDSILFEKNINNDLVIKRGFECDIGETFKYDEPNIITSEDDRDNSGFEALFDETDLETISDFVEDVCLDNIMNSKVDHKSSDLLMSEKDIDTMHQKTDNIIPENVLESLKKSNQQDLILNSPVDLFEELQETLKNMSEVARDGTTKICDLDNNTLNINDLQKIDLSYTNQICDETNNLLDGSIDVDQNVENETFKKKSISISDQNAYKEEQIFEVGQDVDSVENLECLDSDKSISNNTVITVNDISDSSEVKMKRTDITNNLETVVDLLESKTENISQTVDNLPDKNEPLITSVDVPNKNECLITSLHNVVSKINDNNTGITTSFDLKNETLDSVLLNELNSTESIKNITILSSEDIMIDTNKFNESEKMNTINNYNDAENEDTMLIKEVEILSITEKVPHKSSPQDDAVVNEIDAIHNFGTDAVNQVAQTRNENEDSKEKDKESILIDKCSNATVLNEGLGTLLEEKNVITPEISLEIKDYNSSKIEEISNKIKQCDDNDLLNKSIYAVEESVIPANEPKSSIVDVNLITVLEDNISKGITEEQNCGNENLRSLKNKNNASDTFGTNQDVNLDKQLQYDLQPNVNQTLTTDNIQIVPNCTNCENVVNPITELNVLRTEEYILIKNDKNESELINEEPLDNVQQNSLFVQESNILQESNNEEKYVKDINEQCETSSDMKLNNEKECISSKIDLPTEIIYAENDIEVRNAIQQCVLDGTNNIIDDISITQYNVDNMCVDFMLPVTELMTQSFGSSILDKQLVLTNQNIEVNKNTAEKSKQNKKIFENSFESNDIIDDTAVKSKNDVINDFKNSVDLTLNEKETVSDEKINSENITTEIVMNDEEKSINAIFNKSYENLTQSTIFENNDTTLSENTLINSEIISLESSQSIDPCKFDENQVKIQLKENVDSGYEHSTVLDDKENMINNLEHLEAKNEIIYLPDGIIKEDEEKSPSEIQYIQNDETKSINKSTNIVVEQITALKGNETISVPNAQPLDTFVIDFENIKEQVVVEDVIDTEENKNQQRDDVEKISINNIDQEDNLIILASEINCLPLDNDQIIDLHDTKNDLSKHKCSFFVEENTEDCNEITSHPNTYIEILNENNPNQHKEFTECESKALGDFKTLETLSDEETLKSNTVSNEDNLKTNKTGEQNRIENNTDEEKSPILIDVCKSSENDEVLVSDINQIICICDTKLENLNGKLTENLENNQDISENNFGKSLDYKNNLGDTEDLKKYEINTEEIKEEFINLKNLEISETIIDNTLRVDSNKSTKQIENLTFKNPSNLVIDELNISSETPKSECIFINKDIYDINIESSNSNISVTETLQINAQFDIIDQHADISKTETQDTADVSKERANVITKYYSDDNQNFESTLPISEVQENKERNTINDNKENEHSNITPDTKNIYEDKLINKVKINDEINVVTALENKASLLNDFTFESETSDLSTEEPFSILSIMPKLHCVEKIAVNETECVMLENINILKQNELNAAENINHHAQLEHELNIAAIGNIIIDYDSIKENSLTAGEEKKNIEKATMALTLDDHSFEIVSTNVDILDGPIKDMTIKEEQIVYSDTDESSTISTRSNKLLSENNNPEDMAVILNDQIQNTDNLVKENVNTKMTSLNKTTEILNDDNHNQENLGLNKEQSELVDKRQQSIKIQNQIIESSTSVEENDIIDKVKSDVLITKIKSTNDEKTTGTKDIVDINRKLSHKPKDSTTNNIGVSENKIDSNIIINATIDLSNKQLSHDNKNTEKVGVELDNLDTEMASDNNTNPEVIIEFSTNNEIKLTENNVEKDETKRGSKKNKASDQPDDKKSPSPDTTKSNINISEINIDKTKVIDKSIEEINEKLSDNNEDMENVGVKLDKIRPENVSDNNQASEEIIEKVVSNFDKNQKDNEIGTDNHIKSTENVLKKDKTKRGSKKNKSSPQPYDKKSPSPDTTKSNTSVNEINIDTIKVIDKNIDETNKKLSDDIVKITLDKKEPAILPENNEVLGEKIEKDFSNVEKNENQKNNQIDIDSRIKSTEYVEEKDKTKRGSKKKKSSSQPDDKKSPSPDTTKSNINISEINIDKTKVIDKSIEEINEKLSDNNEDMENVGVKLDKIRPENISDNNQASEEIIEKVVSNVDKNENQKNNQIDIDSQIKSTENVEEKDKTKRGSKKKKSSPQPDDKKSPSPESTKNDISVSEINFDTTKIIDKSIEENNKKLSDDKVEIKLDKIEPVILRDNNKILEEKFEKDVSNDDKNENLNNNEIGTDNQIKSTENVVEKDKTKRGSKKKKSSPHPDGKKSPSPDTIKSNISVNELNIDTTKVIDKSNEEINEKLSDDIVKITLDKIEPAIRPDNNEVSEEIIKKDVSNVDKNENLNNNQIGTDNQIESTENAVEKDKIKRGSKKKKSSSQPDDKKSPSPDTTKSNINISEINIDKTKVIDKSIEEINEKLSDNNEDMENVGVKLDKIRQENVSDNNQASEEIIEKVVSNFDKNENKKNNQIGTDNRIKSTENVVEKDKTKCGSKKNKSSSQPDDKKSPSPNTTKSDTSVNEINIDTTKVIDKNIDETNKKLSDEIVETKSDKIEPVNLQSDTKVSGEIIEKEFSNVDKNENLNNNQICTDNQIKSTENVVEKDEAKRGSKKKKPNPQPDGKKSPSPDTIKNNISVNKLNIEPTKVIDKSNEEINEKLSDNNEDFENVGVKLDKILPEIVPDNNKVPEKIIEKDVSNVGKNVNQKNNQIGTDNQIKSTENVVEKDKTKRGSKKKKSSPQPDDKKSPSSDTTNSIISVSENKTDTKIIDNSYEGKNNKLSNHFKDTENIEIELDKLEPKIDSINNMNALRVIETEVSTDKTNNQQNIMIDSDDNTLLDNGIDKKQRGSKKKKTIPEPEYQIPDTTTNKIDSTIIDVTIEDDNRKISDNNKNYTADGTKVEPKTASVNNKSMVEIIEKDFSNNTQSKNQNNGKISTDNKIKSTEEDKTKRECEKDKSIPKPECKKSTSPDKINKKTNEKLEINNEIEKNENTISDLRENFTEQLPNSNIVLEKIEKGREIRSLENNNIDTIGKSKKNIIDKHLLSNTDKSAMDNNKEERGSVKQETSTKSPLLEISVRTDTIVNENVDVKPNDNITHFLTSNKKVRTLSGMTEHDVVDVPEIRSSDKRPVNRYLLDVTDAHKSRPNSLAYRSLTPDPLTSYRSLTPDHIGSYRSLTPECPSYRSSLTPRSKYATSTRYAGSSDRDLYGGSSSSRSSRSSSRSTSPYPPESRISARNLWPPTNLAAYRCLSETSIPLSSRRIEVEATSGWPHTGYGVTTRRRRGSDSFLHDSGVRDGGYYSSWRLSDGRAVTHSATEDLYRTKEAFKGLYFCVRMIDQTVSSGARVKFWCSVIGHPEPRVQWYRDGQKLNSFTYNSSARYQTKYDGGLAQLIIENAQSGDSGEYTCVATNGRDRISTTGFLTVYTSPSVFRKPLLQPSLSVDGIESGRGLYSRTSHDFRLSANDKFDFGCQKFGGDLATRRPEYPKFVSSIIADDVATYGGTIALQVRVQGSPVPNVTWMRESKPLPRLSSKYVYLDEGGLYTLLVMDSTAQDGGKYVCRACNLYGVADTEKAVRVVSPQDYTDRRGVKPAIIVSRPNDRLNVAVGEDITVTLRVAGEPKPKVIWMRGSRDVTFLDRSLKETVNDYVMLSIKKAQPSDAGTYFIIAKNVYGSDRAFVTVGVRKRARSLTPPQIRNTIGRWFGPTGGGCGGGRGGGRGCCANNEVPGPVRSEPTVTDRTNNRISLQWDRPEKPETVLVYRVETRSADEECWRQVGMTPTNAIDVYNLKPGYRYQFRVAARNRFGWSQPVASEGYVDVFEPKCLPEFRQPLPGQTRVLLRHSATLQCHVRGVPEPRVRWFKDGEPLLASDRHAVGRTDGGKCTLTIADAVDCDAGRYSCEAVNDQGRVCTLTVVQVIANRRIVEAERRLQGCLMKNNDFKESAPVFTKHLIDRRVDINSTVRLSCQVNGLPTPLVLWYKDGRPVDFASETEGDRKPPVRDDSDDFYTLELTRVKYDDSGTYAAVASNAIGKASTRCVLEVFNKNRTDPAVPSFVFGLPPTSEAVDSIVLSAQIDAYRPVKVEWFRDGLQLRNGRRVDIITDHDGNLELRIACVTNRDSGTYMLRVSNDTGTVESRCEVNVVEREHKDTGMEQISLINHLYSKKPKFVVKPKFQEVEEGQEVIIDSEIVGDPLPKITWLRDGLKPEYYRDNSEFLCVSNGNRYQLKIPHAKLTHTGTYTLLAANPHGQIKALISLQVYSTGHCKKKMENGTNHATVERLPRISRGLVDIECRENDSVSFECKLNITQETDIRWQKDGKLVRLGKHIKSQLVDGDTARLDISTASPLHEGLYTCTAFNELGQDSTSARLVLLSDSQETAKAPQSNGQRNTMLNSPILAGETNDRCTKRLKRSSAPKFYAVLHDRIADVGETVRFLCSVSGHPPPWSSWEKDGQPIGVNSRMRIREDDDHRSLEICDVTSDDAGLYRITVENKFGKIQATARLEVLTHNQTTNDVQITSSTNGRRQSGSAACAGENFTLSCDIRGNSMSDVSWYKDDEKIKPDGRVTSSLDDLAARLSISNLESADTGVYTCVARCESGVTRCSTELCVFDTKPATDSYLQPPIFVEGLVPKRTADEGEPVQLTVRLQGAVPMSASWLKNDVPVPDCADFEYVVADDRGEFSLLITDPFVKDSGTYSCKVANSFGQAVSSGQLVINEMSSEHQVPIVVELNNNLQDVGEKTANDSTVVTGTALPASILRGPCDTTVLRGAKVVLETSYQGDPEPCVQWLRAGKVLESNAHLCITNERGVSSLTIDSITADDCGKYVVRVDNGHGNDFHYASVAVEGPPDPPAGRPVVSVSETSADVTWSSPAYDGGCMVTGYGVEVRPFNQSDWKLVADKCHSLSHIVRGLAPGESYVFRVRAENMHGSSEASLESTPVYILQTDYGNTLWPKTVNIENGEQFDGQYEVLDELGKGRYGVVYKVKERETNKYYAAKFVRCIKSTDKEKAQEEVDIMNCLRHPKLLQLDAAFDKPREVVLVTEYISGGELFERVVADDFTLTEKDCILFTRQICEGVDYMHKQNVVHLDLKPENIMCQSRTSHYVKLIDFGLAQKIVPGQPMRVLFGTPEFIPPEIIGYEPIGLESDMWSVGVICYVLLSGLSPFMGDNDPETFTNITKAEFDFDDEAFDAVSQDAKDFISALLIKRKELRLTARECLKHKWLAQQDMDMSCVILSTDKLKKFIIRRKWQKTGNAIRALGRMATLSAASRRGVSGGSSAGGGGGGGTGGGCGTGSVLQKLKMASLREEESAGEAPLETLQEIAITETTKNGSGHRSCDARSDSGFSDCPSLASPTATLVRPAKCPSAISEETPPVSDQDRSPPPPSRGSSSPVTRRSPSPTTHRSPSPVTHRSSSPPLTGRPSSPAIRRPPSPATRRPTSPATRRPLSPATCRPTSPATHRPFSPSTRRPLSPTTRGSSYTATRGPSPLATHLRSPLPRNRRDATHPVHDVPLPAGTGVSGMCKTNRIIFDNGRRDGNASSPGIGGGSGIQRKEPIRIQTADNFQKAVAFWKQ